MTKIGQDTATSPRPPRGRKIKHATVVTRHRARTKSANREVSCFRLAPVGVGNFCEARTTLVLWSLRPQMKLVRRHTLQFPRCHLSRSILKKALYRSSDRTESECYVDNRFRWRPRHQTPGQSMRLQVGSDIMWCSLKKRTKAEKTDGRRVVLLVFKYLPILPP
jgi:hypothetical protein